MGVCLGLGWDIRQGKAAATVVWGREQLWNGLCWAGLDMAAPGCEYCTKKLDTDTMMTES